MVDYFNDGPTQNSNLLDSKRLLLDELSANIIDVVMDFGRRDLETLGLACFRVKNINRLTNSINLDENEAHKFISSCLRILGRIKYRYTQSMPRNLK